MKKLIIIDGNSLVNRAYYALPPLTASDGTPAQAVYGFATMLVRLITEQRPDFFAVAFDTKAPTFRHKESELYKATRKGMPDELAIQLPPLKKMLSLIGIRCIECEGYEADDIIGTVVKNCRGCCLDNVEDDIESIIVTGDRDSLQLVDDKISVMLTKRGITDVLHITADNFEKEIGLQPSQIIDYKALCGDSSDNIPGVAGVGEKTATTLLVKYGTLDSVYDNIDSITGTLKNKLIQGKDSAYLSKRLATICTNMQFDCSADSFHYNFPFSAEVREYFVFLGFKSLLKREELFTKMDSVALKSNNAGESGSISLVDTNADAATLMRDAEIIKIESIEKLREVISCSFDTLAFHHEDSLYFAFNDNVSYEINTQTDLLGGGIDFNDIIIEFADTFQNTNIKKLLFDAKVLLKQLTKRGIKLRNYDDIKLMQYLVDMSADYATLRKLTAYHDIAGGMGAAIFPIFSKLSSDLKSLGMEVLYNDIELPLIPVLAEMEEVGIGVDFGKILELGEHFSVRMKELTERIHVLSGIEFNVNSPKQLADVLFNRLGIPYPKKSKTYSTSVEILEEISGEHEVIDVIMEYRTYSKLNNTYIEGLKRLAYPSSVIHTDFRQMVTATGRLSSVEPNLQNIPIRSDEGRVLREIFVAGEDRMLVSADYSQIELRLLAHYSKDEKLISAYKNGEDVHTSTAAEVFGVEKADVTKQMRRDAKAVNFGIIYGISEYGLAKNLKIANHTAKKYIETYFERFNAVKSYLAESVQSAKKLGYAETLLGRKRKIPELFSPNYAIRNFGERVAMNMPLQGTAADIVKIAMLRVNERLQGRKSKLILQVHDELIIDAHNDELQEVISMLDEIMTSVLELEVPLEVNISYGKRWSDCK